MRKRIVLIAFTSIAVLSLFVVLYDQFKPKTNALARTATTTDNVIATSQSFSDVSNYFKTNPGTHVLFVRDSSSDSDYVVDNLLSPLAHEHDVRPTPNIVSVDMSETKDLSVTRLKSTLGIEKYPAFVLVTTNNEKNSFSVDSVIEYDKKKPFSVTDLRKWFFDNKLWTGPYGDN
ncbi:hypothetical protein H9L01_08445 [Erysipelothrix inopinata]|uniref:Uncharacterized protein n=1 Tax=Erysipelothrix inopinata TaxID=225084 RepID=A0A7G9RXR7_9FIRM|nr:hypothetical protein [Erysipelothrix inopinata]QNN60392.1 hypothetical protein H9L01_08445 [Erysipelothrix inopinata]